MKLNKFILILGLILISTVSVFHGQEKKQVRGKEQEKEEKTKLFQLDEVIIEVIEYIRDLEIPNMTVVKPELFPLSIGTTLDTALERQPGVDVQRIQEVGTAVDDDSIKIRGLGSRRIKVMKNGRLMNTSGVAGGYFIDWTMIPLVNIDRVEVVKGVGDPRYGNVLGGLINLVPRRLPTDSPETEIQASSASFDTVSMNLNHAYKPGAFEYSFSVGSSTSNGYLKNGSLSSGNLDFHFGYDFNFSGRLTADITYSKLRKGFIVPGRVSNDPDDPNYITPLDPDFPASDGEYMYGGMGAYPEPGSWWEKKKWLFDFGYEQAFGNLGLLSLRFWQNHGNRDAYNTRAALNRIFHKTFYDDRSFGYSLLYKHFVKGHILTMGVDSNHLKDDGDSNHPDDFRSLFRNGYYVSARNLDFFIMGNIRLLEKKLSIVPGVRFLSYKGISGPSGRIEGIPDVSMNGWAPSLKLTYQDEGENIIFLSLARALRMPTPPEHYWHYDFDDAGVDTSALPFVQEDGLMLQGGWKTVLPSRTKIEISPYFYSIQNYIQFDLINFVAYNIDQTRIYGIEIEVAQQFGGGWSSFLNYTYQKSRTWGDDFMDLFVRSGDRDFNKIPGLPEHKVNVGLQFKSPAGASAAVFLQAVSAQDVIYSNNRLWNSRLGVYRQNSYARVDIEGRYPLSRLVEIGLFARNILDEFYQERYGFPAAGRTMGISFRTRF